MVPCLRRTGAGAASMRRCLSTTAACARVHAAAAAAAATATVTPAPAFSTSPHGTRVTTRAGVALAAAQTCTSAAPLHTTQRHKSVAETIHNMTIMRMGAAHKPQTLTSKDIPAGPRAGVGHDPVFAEFMTKQVAGPLRRKHSNTPEDYLNVDEAAKWMDAKAAANVLGIKEEDLPKLNKVVLEEKFRTAYKERTNAHQEEVAIATEVLLEYLDSSVHIKKSKQYYRKFLDNARSEIDQELTSDRRRRGQSLMLWFAMAITGACGIVLFVAYSRNFVSRRDVSSIGARTSEYFVMTFLQPKNTEPKPDYATRYFNTPTSMELDKKTGRYNRKFQNSEETRLAEQADAYAAEEEAEMVKLFNEERERAGRDRQNDTARDSRVAVYLPEELEGGGAVASASRERSKKVAFEEMSFRDFTGLLASNFGGGSRFQRLTDETSARAEHLNAARERVKSEET